MEVTLRDIEDAYVRDQLGKVPLNSREIRKQFLETVRREVCEKK